MINFKLVTLKQISYFIFLVASWISICANIVITIVLYGTSESLFPKKLGIKMSPQGPSNNTYISSPLGKFHFR